MTNVVSLFSGCGGLDWGFKQEGFRFLWANDLLLDACKSYQLNIGSHIQHGDINEIDINAIPKSDIIIGGPPCQGFSGIGKRDPDDERSKLVWSFLGIIQQNLPKIFLFENVTGLKSSKAKNGKKVIENLVEAFRNVDEGYSIQLFTLNAADYGVPQKRKRVFILGNKLGIDISEPPKTHNENGLNKKRWVSSFEALSDLPEPSDNGFVTTYRKKPDNEFMMKMRNSGHTTLHKIPYASDKDREIISYVKPGGNYWDVPDSVATRRILYFKKTGGRTTTYGRLEPHKPGYTLNTYFDRPNIGCNIHYEFDRMITIREGLRLQSFPDDFDLKSSTKRNYYLQVGNAVPPLLSLAWARHLKKFLQNS